MIEGALVILARFQGDDRAAVGEGQHAGFLAVEPLFDDQAIAGLAEDAADHDLVDGIQGLAEVVANVDPLAGGQAVGLEDHPHGAAQDEVAGLGGRVEDAFLAALFDLDLHPRAEHLARVHDPIDGVERLAGGPAVQCVADRRAAPRADDQGDLARQHVMLGVGPRAEDPIVGRGDGRLPHQLLGEKLAPLELGGFLSRAEDPQALALKDVDDPLGQRLLRADNRQADSLALGELEQAPVIARLDRHVLRVERRSGVARRANDRRHAGRFLQFPAKSVLTPPLADHQDFQHALPSSPRRRTASAACTIL